MALRYHSHRHGGGFHRIMPLPPPQPPTHHISSLSCPTLFDLRISLCRQYPNRRTGGPQSINSAWGVVPPLNVEPSSFDAGTIDRVEMGGGDMIIKRRKRERMQQKQYLTQPKREKQQPRMINRILSLSFISLTVTQTI